MIALWMLSATLFTALLGVAALCGESALRTLKRPTRGPWLLALCAAVVWPVIATVARRVMLQAGPASAISTRLPSIHVVPPVGGAFAAWAGRLDLILVVLWLVSSAIVALRALRAFTFLRDIRNHARPCVVDEVPVLVSDRIGPAVVGVRDPRVLLPEWLLALEAPLRRLVLHHEVEHCRARDPLLIVAASAALATMPWNLPLWWIARRLRLALEIDCDARVLASGADPQRYGTLLLLVSLQQSGAGLAPMLAAST